MRTIDCDDDVIVFSAPGRVDSSEMVQSPAYFAAVDAYVQGLDDARLQLVLRSCLTTWPREHVDRYTAALQAQHSPRKALAHALRGNVEAAQYLPRAARRLFPRNEPAAAPARRRTLRGPSWAIVGAAAILSIAAGTLAGLNAAPGVQFKAPAAHARAHVAPLKDRHAHHSKPRT